MSEDQTLETAVKEDSTLEREEISETAALDDQQSSQTTALDDEQSSQTAALDDERPTSRSDAKDPWHGLNDFDED